MIKRKYVTIGFLALCLTVTLLLSVTITSSENVYDPWADIDGDGYVNIIDLGLMSDAWLTEGTPIHKKGNISVPAAVFIPESQEHNYSKWFNYLINDNTHTYTSFYADVQLPHGATLTNVTFYWDDYGTDYIICDLARCNELNTQYIAYACNSPSTEAPGPSFSYDDILDYATVDNNNYAYVLHVNLPWTNTYRFKLARIEWEYLP